MSPTKIALPLLLAFLAAGGARAAESDYRVVEKDGKTLYCSKRLATGSHVKKQKTCLTQAELDVLKEETARGLRNISRQAPPPQGT